MPDYPDPFRPYRTDHGRLDLDVDGEPVPLVLRLEEVRRVARDWETFSSDNPFKITIRTEEGFRDVRQLPIETDPPGHTEYRALVKRFFDQPLQPAYVVDLRALIDRCLEDILAADRPDVVRDFALPLQSRALARLLRVPEAEADEWVGWGINVFTDPVHREGGATPGAAVDDYTERALDRAEREPGDDLFSALDRAEFRGRPLTRDEKRGFVNLVFAGGRDTVIHTVSSIFAHAADHPGMLDDLRGDERLHMTAAEEFVRAVSPVTALARTCPRGAEVAGTTVTSGGRVGLCWASANHDERHFHDPDRVRLDRSPNPHVGYGYGAHACIGARHTRALLRSLLDVMSRRLAAVEVVEAVDAVDELGSVRRRVGYELLRVRLRERG